MLIYLKEEKLKRLDKAIENVGLSKEYYIKKINKKIDRYIEDLEDIAIADKELAKIKAGEETIPHEEIKAKYGL